MSWLDATKHDVYNGHVAPGLSRESSHSEAGIELGRSVGPYRLFFLKEIQGIYIWDVFMPLVLRMRMEWAGLAVSFVSLSKQSMAMVKFSKHRALSAWKMQISNWHA